VTLDGALFLREYVWKFDAIPLEAARWVSLPDEMKVASVSSERRSAEGREEKKGKRGSGAYANVQFPRDSV
jgi:hypothetical protein